MNNNKLTTPLARVRGLGSAKKGTEHFWQQRLTALALIPLTIFLMVTIVGLIGADYARAQEQLSNLFVSAGLLLLVLVGTWHMRLGLQSVIEDYLHGKATKLCALIFNNFFTGSIAVVSALAILKILLGS